MTDAATLSPKEVTERRQKISRRRRIRELREIWAQDLKMLVRCASDTVKDGGPVDESHLEKIYVTIGHVDPDGYEEYATCVINKAGTLHLVPDLYEVVKLDHHDRLVPISLTKLVKNLMTNKTLDAVEAENPDNDLIAIRSALEELASPDNI